MKKFSLFAVLAFALLLAGYTTNATLKVLSPNFIGANIVRYLSNVSSGTNVLYVPDNQAAALTVKDYEANTTIGTVATTGGAASVTLASTLGMTDYVFALAAGTTGGSATPITHQITGSTGPTNAGLILPAVTGQTVIVGNVGLVGPILLYPPAGGTIGASGANIAFPINSNHTYMCFSQNSSLAYMCVGN